MFNFETIHYILDSLLISVKKLNIYTSFKINIFLHACLFCIKPNNWVQDGLLTLSIAANNFVVTFTLSGDSRKYSLSIYMNMPLMTRKLKTTKHIAAN